MTLFDDLAQFRDLIPHLPGVAFRSAGVVHPRISLFAATRAESDVVPVKALVGQLPFDGDFTAAVVRADADLRLYELDLDHPAKALTAADAARTAAYGMTAIEPGPDLFALAAISDGLQVIDAVEDGLARSIDPLILLADVCGRDTCAIFGAILAARMAQLPVILDSRHAVAATLLLHRLSPAATSHCAVPRGSPCETMAIRAGLAVTNCTDHRPLYSLVDAIVHTRTDS